MEPRRAAGKQRRAMVASTEDGREVGPGEKLCILEEWRLGGGVSEPRRAGWLGSMPYELFIVCIRCLVPLFDASLCKHKMCLLQYDQ